MSLEHVCPCGEKCPVKRAMETISGKWKLTILCSLSTDGITRYNELKRKIEGISNTMLAKSLKELEDDGLVRRIEYMEVPARVEYEITPVAEKLKNIIDELYEWGSVLE